MVIDSRDQKRVNRNKIAIRAIVVFAVLMLGSVALASINSTFTSSSPNYVLASASQTVSSSPIGQTTYNWAGYEVNGPYHSVTDVKGTWVVPNVSCSSQATSSTSWVGIDDANPTLVQTGTGANCVGGRVITNAWYVFLCCNEIGIKHTVKPNDLMMGEVKYSSGKFTVSLKDVTQRWTFSLTKAVSGAQRSSAEWIIERPTVCYGSSCSLTLLADFKTTNWRNDKATISGFTGYIGQFQKIPTDSVYVINMVSSPPSSALLAFTSSLRSYGDFSITWTSSG